MQRQGHGAMMVVVSLVSTIVHVYATGYMDHDKYLL
ncbi:MAG TPA: hypothetical protein EYP18_12180 [Desulfobacterales bacterium]|nr:hypothetical protein [Desulfobacterales bacterium]